jgi:hypothetical protein
VAQRPQDPQRATRLTTFVDLNPAMIRINGSWLPRVVQTTFTMAETMEIETKRLLLREWRKADRDLFAKLNADSRVMRYFPPAFESGKRRPRRRDRGSTGTTRLGLVGGRGSSRSLRSQASSDLPHLVSNHTSRPALR